MSNSPTFDPKNGFIALPFDLLDFDLTPGAFRTLIEFCKMSNLDGFCWPSLTQIGEKLGRSKASISAYIKELRETGLLKTHEQKTATGYNYRLKFELTFWKSWRKKMASGKSTETQKLPSPKIVQITERRVQPTERNSINHKHLNQKEDSSGFAQIKNHWSELVKNESYPNFQKDPEQKLVDETIKILNSLKADRIDISVDIKIDLKRFISLNNISASQLASDKMSLILAEKLSDCSQVTLFFEALNKMWKPFWKHLPSQKQITELLVSLQLPIPDDRKYRVLQGYLARWKHWSNATKKVA